jgi:hypothetical protein
MFLKDLIKWLEKQPPNTKVPVGFGHPHSFRERYADLAFVPIENTTVGQMLVTAKTALGSTYSGWKGGEFTMYEYSQCWLAEEGCDGEVIGPVLLNYMVGAYERDR